jgi:GTP-binding protein
VLVLSKADLVTPARAQAAVVEWQERLGPDVPVLATSSATRAGVRGLGELLLRIVPDADAEAVPEGDADIGAVGAPAVNTDTVEEELAEHMVFRPGSRDGGRGYVVQRLGPGSFAVDGRGVERLLSRYDTNNDDALAYVEERLRKIGVLDALQREGFVAGDEVRIAGVVFELDADGPG